MNGHQCNLGAMRARRAFLCSRYTQRLARHRRGAFSSVDDTGPRGGSDGKLAGQLLDCATVHGAAALGVDAGAIAAGRWADFCLVDLGAAAVSGAADGDLLGACVFGGSGEGLVVDTCVAGAWTSSWTHGAPLK